ncbi:uncharacterized protein METZ01_LOCUS355941 [marine metagenome]|uniref:Uncharacterized protein n=1 Tax=marine metagenome TaxID=408172 RepID=A0A382S1J2_9ZZZZ
MIIPINEQYRVTSDAHQWTVQKRRARNNKEDWECQTYHPSVDAAVRSLGERMVRECKTDTLVDALKAVETIATTLSQALTPSIEEVSQTIEGLTKNQTRTDISPQKPTRPAEANYG